MTNQNTRQILYEKSAGYRFDAALYRSTPIHHAPEFYTKRELVGARPLHLAAQDRSVA